uniref:Uncharacterized protein n=2 Tax=Chryseobacterium TaxID=59732 RepID=A0AAU6WRE0_9FLAO
MRRKHQQKVTGIVVNEKLNVERAKLRKFRALLHNIEINGWQDQTWGRADHLIHAVEGYINFVHMVNPSKASAFKEKLKTIITRHGVPFVEVNEIIPEVLEPAENTETERKIIVIKEEKADWWNIF